MLYSKPHKIAYPFTCLKIYNFMSMLNGYGNSKKCSLESLSFCSGVDNKHVNCQVFSRELGNVFLSKLVNVQE